MIPFFKGEKRMRFILGAVVPLLKNGLPVFNPDGN